MCSHACSCSQNVRCESCSFLHFTPAYQSTQSKGTLTDSQRKTLIFFSDAERLVYEFYEDINAFTLATYFRALVFMPTKTQLHQFYFPSAQQQLRLPKVMSGTPETWDACLCTMPVGGRIHKIDRIATSPCSQMMAYNVAGAIVVCNLETRAMVAKLDISKYSFLTVVEFLSDGRLRAGFEDGEIATWDADLMFGSQCEEGFVEGEVISFSRDGAYVASCSTDHLRVLAGRLRMIGLA